MTIAMPMAASAARNQRGMAAALKMASKTSNGGKSAAAASANMAYHNQ